VVFSSLRKADVCMLAAFSLKKETYLVKNKEGIQPNFRKSSMDYGSQ
jgi:hypothetical protein